MKLTGERPIEGETPDSLLALHAAQPVATVQPAQASPASPVTRACVARESTGRLMSLFGPKSASPGSEGL